MTTGRINQVTINRYGIAIPPPDYPAVTCYKILLYGRFKRGRPLAVELSNGFRVPLANAPTSPIKDPVSLRTTSRHNPLGRSLESLPFQKTENGVDRSHSPIRILK